MGDTLKTTEIPAVSDDLSMGELGRNLTAIRQDIGKITEGLENRPDWHDVDRLEKKLVKNHDVDIGNLNRQVSDLAETLKWALRFAITSCIGLGVTILSAVIVAIIKFPG